MAESRDGVIGRPVIVCGLPGSGKTTLARRLEAEHDAVRFCPDDDDDPDVPSGRPMKGRRHATGPGNNDAELLRRYPALRRYGQ